MRTKQLRDLSTHALALVAALSVGGLFTAPAWAAPAVPAASHERPVAVEEDVTLFTAVPGAVYLNGGIGHNEQVSMRKDASHWPLRMTFSDKASNEFVADVGLKVFDAHGQAVLRLKDAGPMTFVQLPKGEYRVTANYKGQTLTREVHVGAKGIDENFHWAI